MDKNTFKPNEEEIKNANDILLKKFRNELENCEVIPVSSTITNESLEDKVHLFKIEELVYSKEENSLYKLTTVLNSVSEQDCSVFLIIDSDGNKTNFYLGVRANSDKVVANTQLYPVLENSLLGQFPGTKTSNIDEPSRKEIVKKLFSNNQSISCVSCIANVKNQSIQKNEEFVQGIEKFVDSMQNEQYTAIILSEGQSNETIEELRQIYLDTYSILSEYSEQQVSIANSKNNSYAESYMFDPKKKDSSDDSKVMWTTSASALLVSFSKNYPSKTLSKDEGTSLTVSSTKKNKTVERLLEQLDIELKRFQEFDSQGMWECAAYFMSGNRNSASRAASTYLALMRGENTGVETFSINSWKQKKDSDNKNFIEIENYLKHFCHPKFNYKNNEVYATCQVSGNELAIHMGLPRSSVRGLPVIEHAKFAKEVYTYSQNNNSKMRIGNVFNMGEDTGVDLCLDRESFSSHAFVTGSTGSGKSNSIYKLLDMLGTNFTVIEPAKGEYKNVFGTRDGVEVYGTNPYLTNLLKINPFSFPKGIHIYEHIDRLVEIFNACWPMYAAMPAVLKDAIISAYESTGWDMIQSKCSTNPAVYPSFVDVCSCIEKIINDSSYSADTKGDYIGSLVTRLNSLTNGVNSLIFAQDELSNEDLFDNKVIIDLSRIGSLETKSLAMGILIMKLSEYRMSSSNDMNCKLRHITVLEEAHNILKNTSTDQSQEGANLTGKSVEMLSNAIAEMRTYGEGFIIADQSPSSVDISAIKNTNTKIIMRLPEENDRRVAGKSAGLKDDQLDEISKLPTGVAVIYQNDFVEPVLCKIDKYDVNDKSFEYDGQIEYIDKKNITTEVLKFLISRGNIDKIDISQVIDEIRRSLITTQVKLSLIQYLNEYNNSGKLEIWENDSFEALSIIVCQLVFENKKISKVLGSCKNVEMINTLLKTEFNKICYVDRFTNSQFSDLCQCVLKKLSIETGSKAIYAEWKKQTLINGGVLK